MGWWESFSGGNVELSKVNSKLPANEVTQIFFSLIFGLTIDLVGEIFIFLCMIGATILVLFLVFISTLRVPEFPRWQNFTQRRRCNSATIVIGMGSRSYL